MLFSDKMGRAFTPQISDTGRQGRKNGYNNAEEIGALLEATRLADNAESGRQGKLA
jgi:hypothetical protein